MTDIQNPKERDEKGRYVRGCKNPSGFIAGTQAARDRVRSRITQGKLFNSKTDSRSNYSRRFKAIVERYTKELGGNPMQWQLTAIRQIAMLTATQEKMEQAAANGERVNAKEYGRLSNDISRRLRDLGIINSRYGPNDGDDENGDIANGDPPPSLREYAKQGQAS